MIGVSFSFSDLVRDFRDAIRGSNEIENFCLDNFGTTLKMAIGHDERREWGESEAPFIIIVPTGRVTGLSAANITYNIDMDLAIKDSTFSDSAGINIEEMEGFYKLDEFTVLLENLFIALADGKNIVTDSIDISYNDSMFFPLHVATINISLSVDHLMNGTLGLK